jgi:uncharacterized protein (TIGR02145 family)
MIVNTMLQVKRFNLIKYGYLYNWYAITNIASSGWRVPDDNDWNTLATNIDAGTGNVGGKLKETGFEHWLDPNTGATNESGFNARGGGFRIYSDGIFTSLMSNGIFWSSSEYDILTASVRFAVYQNGYFGGQGFLGDQCYKKSGNSISLMRDTLLPHGTIGKYTGNDGRKYKTICIYGQEWLSENLAETKDNLGVYITNITDSTTWIELTTGARCAYDNNENNV